MTFRAKTYHLTDLNGGNNFVKSQANFARHQVVIVIPKEKTHRVEISRMTERNFTYIIECTKQFMVQNAQPGVNREKVLTQVKRRTVT